MCVQNGRNIKLQQLLIVPWNTGRTVNNYINIKPAYQINFANRWFIDNCSTQIPHSLIKHTLAHPLSLSVCVCVCVCM